MQERRQGSVPSQSVPAKARSVSAEVARIVGQLSRISDALASRNPNLGEDERLSRQLTEVADAIEQLDEVPEQPSLPAHSPGIARLHPEERGLAPRLGDVRSNDRSLTGSVTFSARFGGTAAVHGGAIGLFFDDAIGRLANSEQTHGIARTAYLHVDFRRLAPIDVPLDFRADVTFDEGRKKRIAGTISLDGSVLAEAEGLWIRARPAADL